MSIYYVWICLCYTAFGVKERNLWTLCRSSRTRGFSRISRSRTLGIGYIFLYWPMFFLLLCLDVDFRGFSVNEINFLTTPRITLLRKNMGSVPKLFALHKRNFVRIRKASYGSFHAGGMKKLIDQRLEPVRWWPLASFASRINTKVSRYMWGRRSYWLLPTVPYNGSLIPIFGISFITIHLWISFVYIHPSSDCDEILIGLLYLL